MVGLEIRTASAGESQSQNVQHKSRRYVQSVDCVVCKTKTMLPFSRIRTYMWAEDMAYAGPDVLGPVHA